MYVIHYGNRIQTHSNGRVKNSSGALEKVGLRGFPKIMDHGTFSQYQAYLLI
jgi:hypothetical protein